MIVKTAAPLLPRSSRRMLSGCGAGNFACRRLSGCALVAAMRLAWYYTPHNSSQLAKNAFSCGAGILACRRLFRRRFGCGYAAWWGRRFACPRARSAQRTRRVFLPASSRIALRTPETGCHQAIKHVLIFAFVSLTCEFAGFIRQLYLALKVRQLSHDFTNHHNYNKIN